MRRRFLISIAFSASVGLLAVFTFAIIGAVRPSAKVATAGSVADSSKPDALPVLFDAPAFSFVDQEGRRLTNRDLRGTVWVCDFIFTRRAGPCPLMTATMARLQRAIDKDVKFVSFSIDPEFDSQAVLKQYADTYGADPVRWHFLATEKPAIFEVAAGMKLAAKDATTEQPILHSTKFLLIDAEGRVRSIYSSTDDGAMQRLMTDAVALAKSSRAAEAADTILAPCCQPPARP
jgi:protein SCO1/2